MRLRSLERGDIETVAGWLGEPENYKWLDFGGGQQVLPPASLALMMQRPAHDLRLYTSDEGQESIGIVALSSISPLFRTATLWYVLGSKRHQGQGYTRKAVAQMLRVGFDEHGLASMNAWAVAGNTASVRILEGNGFRPIGRQRACHLVDGEPRDRLLFDILATEQPR